MSKMPAMPREVCGRSCVRAEAEAADDLTGPDDTESARERAVGVTLERPPVSADWRDERERERRPMRDKYW